MAGMSRYAFTDSNGHQVGFTVEADNGPEARDKIIAATGHTGPLHCNHLSDDHHGEGTDPIFSYGPDAVEAG